MQDVARGFYNSVMFAFVLLIAHFLVKGTTERWTSTPQPADAVLEMQGGDVDAISVSTDQRRRAAEQKAMLFAYVQSDGGDGTAHVGAYPVYSTYADEPVMNGGSLGLGALTGYESCGSRGTPL